MLNKRNYIWMAFLITRPKNRRDSTNMPNKNRVDWAGRKFFLFLLAFHMLISRQTCFLGLNFNKITIKPINNACMKKNSIVKALFELFGHLY